MTTLNDGTVDDTVGDVLGDSGAREGGAGEGGLLWFRPPGDEPAVMVPALLADSADPAELDPHVRGLRVIGHLLAEGHEADRIVLDEATGRVFSMYLFEDRPDLIDVLPLAPSVEALTRYTEAMGQLATTRGRFADFAGRFGEAAVTEATARFLSILAEEEWDGGGWGSAGERKAWDHPLPAFWRIAALIRPLALIAEPGRGLLLDLPEGLLPAEFGARQVVRFDPAALPAALVHEPTRRFLLETGLPVDASMFTLFREEPVLLTLARYRERNGPAEGEPDDYPEGMAVPPDRLFSLGWLIHDTEVVIDGHTGRIHGWTGGRLHPLNADISTLAFSLWILERERTLDTTHRLTDDMYQQLADTMAAVLPSVDPVACEPTGEKDDWRYWPEVFHDQAGDVL
ncbi:SUKH-4 family immunity protein [Streptomyces sp. NBC_01506]|uniref:SUKH-4 family immunity protein n=1 Tax=Streptomyces sp. NBC_01506 TaxID=2903887 RepID=UPI0038663EAE